ncbi:MAG: alpha-glucan family phosphorylase [Bacteriovoracaceae bacterium]|nr:alpha-glucan family phosphorylase [Bacteriovoracaceae bacterium]
MKLRTFTALPTTPDALKPLLEIASNMWFSWNWDARQLFAKLDNELWMKANKNPLRLLCDISQEKLKEQAANEKYVAEVDAVYATFKKYLTSKTWFQKQHGGRDNTLVAYFSCEFGIHESLPIYSGGLGVLAGDHLKAASDLGIPLVAIGFLYRQGYFRQGISVEGDQQEFYPENDRFTMPVQLVKNDKDRPLVLSMDIGGDEVFYQIWQVKVGRIDLYLLDTNLMCNLPKNRDITKRLYDADRDMRIRQEILLGMGGIAALKALNISPSVYHINEGHSAFLILERLKDLIEGQYLSFDEAKEVVTPTNIFTTHTPVPAGNERFDMSLVKRYLGTFVQKRLGLAWDDFVAMGRENPANMDEEFCMTVLALKFASLSNGVARLHGEISRDMWKNLYPDVPSHEVPIKHVTNGVHTKSWLSQNFEKLFARYLSTAYVKETADFTLWDVLQDVPDNELWNAHMHNKKKLVEHVRRSLKKQLKRRGGTAGDYTRIKGIFDPDVLTIGFARRFAPYKRGAMIFSDFERMAKIVNNANGKVQLIFAGKAHPADNNGKAIIKKIVELANKPEFCKNVVLLEDYDIDVARFMVQGVDIWLNTPRRPMEASGTSGMKAAMNGALNLSILDGWWDEAFDGNNGWAIGHAEFYDNEGFQDEMESKLLYRLLEDEIVPLYYKKDENNIPTEWIKMMKHCIESCGANFNAHRMVMDYLKDYYLKAEQFNTRLRENDCQKAKELASWKKRVKDSWSDLEILEVEPPEEEIIYSGSDVRINARLKFKDIDPNDLLVEVYHGPIDVDKDDQLKNPVRTKMNCDRFEHGVAYFSVAIPCKKGGRYGYTVRVLPGHEDMLGEFLPSLIKWE